MNNTKKKDLKEEGVYEIDQEYILEDLGGKET